MADKKGFKGGEIPTGLGAGNDGFSGVVSHKATFANDPAGSTVQTGREETIGDDAYVSGGRKK